MKNAFGSKTAIAGAVPTKAKVSAAPKGKPAGPMSAPTPPVGKQPAGGVKSARTTALPSTPRMPATSPSGRPAQPQTSSKASGNSSSGLDTAMSNHANQMHKAPPQRGPKTTGY